MIVSVVAIAQKSTLYNPEANAKMDIENALKKAKAEHKFVLLQGGGNWCPWCIEFHRFCTADKQSIKMAILFISIIELLLDKYSTLLKYYQFFKLFRLLIG